MFCVAGRLKPRQDPNEHHLRGFLAYLKIEKGLSPQTLSAYSSDLAQFASVMKRPSLLTATRADVRKFLDRLTSEGTQGRSIARKLAALRHFYKYLLLDKVITDDPTLNIDSPKQWKVIPKALSTSEIEGIEDRIATLTGSPLQQALSVRNLAMVEVLYGSALRVSELTGLRLSDLKLDAGYMIVRGKGDKERTVPIGASSQKALQNYLRESRPKLLKGKSSSHLFVKPGGGALTRNRVWQVLDGASSGARHASPHMLRHSCATHMVGNGADLRTVQTILGHADIATTQVYTHSAMDRLKAAHRRFHPRGRSQREQT